MKEIFQRICLVVFIAIVGDKSDQGEEVVRTIWVFFHLAVHLNNIVVVIAIINDPGVTLSAISGGRMSSSVVAARRFMELFLIGPRGRSAYLIDQTFGEM